MEIAEHLVMDDPVAIGGELYIVEHLVVSNEIADFVSLACVDGDLCIAANVEFFAASVDSLVSDVDEELLLKYYVQFVLGCVDADWVAHLYFIMIFQWMEHRYLIFRFVLLTLMKSEAFGKDEVGCRSF